MAWGKVALGQYQENSNVMHFENFIDYEKICNLKHTSVVIHCQISHSEITQAKPWQQYDTRKYLFKIENKTYTYPPYTALMSMTFLTLDQSIPMPFTYDLLTTRFQCA